MVLAFARPAQATGPLPIDLTWDAPAECPTHDEVMAELMRITRVKPGRSVTPIHAQAKIERIGEGRYRLQLRTQREDQTGDTDLDAATCPVLKRGVTLVLALALGDGVDLVDEKAPPEPAEAPPQPPAVAPPVPRKMPPPAPKLTAPRVQAGLRATPWLALSGAWGQTAKPAFGPQLGMELGQIHWHALAQVSFYPARAADAVQGIEAAYGSLFGALGGCARAPLRAWSVSACLSFEVGGIRGSSRAASQPVFEGGSAIAPWYAVAPALVVTGPLAGRLHFRFAAALSIAKDPPHFAVHGVNGSVFEAARFVPALSLGLSL